MPENSRTSSQPGSLLLTASSTTPLTAASAPVRGGDTDFGLVHACVGVLGATQAGRAAGAGGGVTPCCLKDLGCCLAVTAWHWHAVHIHPHLLCSWHQVGGYLDLPSSLVHQFRSRHEVLCLASCARPARTHSPLTHSSPHASNQVRTTKETRGRSSKLSVLRSLQKQQEPFRQQSSACLQFLTAA